MDKPIPKKRQIELHKQNFHIAVQHEKSQKALIQLMEKGITVLKVEIEGTYPVIQVKDTPHCKQLDGATSSIIGSGIGRREIKCAQVCHCLVQWSCTNSIH